jgi:hypothetical protein
MLMEGGGGPSFINSGQKWSPTLYVHILVIVVSFFSLVCLWPDPIAFYKPNMLHNMTQSVYGHQDVSWREKKNNNNNYVHLYYIILFYFILFSGELLPDFYLLKSLVS